MRVGLQLGITVGGQHLPVSINIDTCSFGLFEQRLEVFEIVARNEDGLAFLVAQRHLSRHRMTVCIGIAPVQQFHRLDRRGAASQRHIDPLIERQVVALDGGQALMDIRVDTVVLLAENLGVIAVCRDAFDTEKHGMLERQDVRVVARVGFQTHGFGLFDQSVDTFLGYEVRGFSQ
jgi:hypothetical protein